MMIIVVIGIVYCALILWLYFGVHRISIYKATYSKNKTRFTIIIPFRDEGENLDALLVSLLHLEYPKQQFEVLLIDDGSSDNSMQIITSFQKAYPNYPLRVIKNIRKTASPKKDAISTAIQQSNFEWILATDADCVVPKTWLQTYDAFIVEKNPVFIAGLVSYHQEKSFLHVFQQLDWMSLTGVTMGGFGWKNPLLCSGANLAYLKKAFVEVKGFEANDTIASGDDMFLLHKMQKAYPYQVHFLNAAKALVQTKGVRSWKALFEQRKRWASKTVNIPNGLIKGIGVLVFLTNLSLIVLLLLSLFEKEYWMLLVTVFIIKLFIDTVLVYKVARITQRKFPILFWIASSLIYPFFSLAVVFIGFFSSYIWKGRRFLK